jgi:hypothetical protein
MDNLVNIGIPTAVGALASDGATAIGARLPQVLGDRKWSEAPPTKRVVMENHACTQHTMPLTLCLPALGCVDGVVVFSGLQYQAFSKATPRGEGCIKAFICWSCSVLFTGQSLTCGCVHVNTLVWV